MAFMRPRVVRLGSRRASSIWVIQKFTAHSIPSDISATTASISAWSVTTLAKSLPNLSHQPHGCGPTIAPTLGHRPCTGMLRGDELRNASCCKKGGGLGACPAPPVQTANLLVRRSQAARLRLPLLEVLLEPGLPARLELRQLVLLIRS